MGSGTPKSTRRAEWPVRVAVLCWLGACSGRSIDLESDTIGSDAETSGSMTLTGGDCDVDTYRCSGADYQRCEATVGGASWVTQTTCDSPALCGPVGGCLTSACEPDETVCVGPVIQRCNPFLTSFDDVDVCESAAQCDPDGCRSSACEAGELRCNGRRLERCRDDRGEWVFVETCGEEQYCDRSSRRCVQYECTLGSARCDGSLAQQCVRASLGARAWETVLTCDTPELCVFDSSLGCIGPTCALGELRCEDRTTVMQCNESRTDWEPLRVCANGGICDAEAPGGCSPTG